MSGSVLKSRGWVISKNSSPCPTPHKKAGLCCEFALWLECPENEVRLSCPPPRSVGAPPLPPRKSHRACKAKILLVRGPGLQGLRLAPLGPLRPRALPSPGQPRLGHLLGSCLRSGRSRPGAVWLPPGLGIHVTQPAGPSVLLGSIS